MELEECGTFDVGSTTLDIEADGPLTTRAEEATRTVEKVGTEVTDVLQSCGGKGSMVGAMIHNKTELMDGVPKDIISFNA